LACVRLALAFLAALALLASPAMARASDSVAELVRQARAHEEAHQDDLAARRYTEALALDPTDGEAYLGLAALRIRAGDAREAERVYSVALSHVPSLAAALAGRAEARWALGFREEAERDLEEYARGHEESAALRLLAGWYAEEGKMPAQLATWRRLRVLAARSGDAALEREAKTMVRALQLLVDAADPVLSPPDHAPTRAGLAAIARRGG
jgi:tetratricopeptide (TPR) repeat protein